MEKSNSENNQAGPSTSAPFTIKSAIVTLLNDNIRPETDPEIYKAALDAVRFEHQRLQNEFMCLMTLNNHIQQQLESLENEKEMNYNLQEHNSLLADLD